jgi:hypothetical protein
MVLMANGATTARIEQIVDDETFIIVIFVTLAAHHSPTWRWPALKTGGARWSHHPSLLLRAPNMGCSGRQARFAELTGAKSFPGWPSVLEMAMVSGRSPI